MIDRRRPLVLSRQLTRLPDALDLVESTFVRVPLVVNEEAQKLLELFESPRRLDELTSLDSNAKRLEALIETFVSAGILVPGDEPEDEYLFREGLALKERPDLRPPKETLLGASAGLAEADVHVVGIPFDRAAHLPGAARGPGALRTLSLAMPCAMDPKTGRHRGMRDLGCDRVLLADALLTDHGDVRIEDHEGHEAVYARIAAVVHELRSTTTGVPVFLGGDHSITAPILRAYTDTPVFVVHFDAHTDLYTLHDAMPHSHGNVMERVRRMAHVEGLLQIGVRDLLQPWWEPPPKVRTLGEERARTLTPGELLEQIPPSARCYLTVDIDVLSPADAPGTGTPMPGGMPLHQLCAFLTAIGEHRDVVGVDLVEIAPSLGGGDLTPITGMRILTRLLDAIVRRRRGGSVGRDERDLEPRVER